MRGQLTLEFLFASAVYLAFLFVLVSAHDATMQGAIETSRKAHYAASSNNIAILYPMLRLNNEYVEYAEKEKRWVGDAKICAVYGTELVVCGPLNDSITVTVYSGRALKHLNAEIV